jgi:hypothetical protein
MSKKSNKRSNKRAKRTRTRKQKTFVMIGCSNKNKNKKSCKNNKVFSSLGNKSCSTCCPNCNFRHDCPGNCYLNRRIKKQKGGTGCGSSGCPIGGLSYKQMNQFGGDYASYPKTLERPIIIQTPNKDDPSNILGIGQNGGNFFKEISAMPGPFTGSAWEPNKLPGENGFGGDRNYLKSYAGNITNDPQLKMTMDGAGYKTMNSLVGGYTYDKNSRPISYNTKSKRGGGIIPQDLVNLGRDFTFNFKNAYNTLNGYKSPVDPAPYKGQLTGALNNNRFAP